MDPGTTREVSEGIKVWLAGGGMVLALVSRRLPARVSTALLALLLFASVLNYCRWGPSVPFERVDNYDLLHYYLNAKYFDELGYFDLYPALILADHEEGGPYFNEGNRYRAQDEDGHTMRPISHALARGETVKAERFNEATWRTFKSDAVYLQRTVPGMGDKSWRELIQDHGYNGTTVWTVIAKPLARAVPIERVKWLCCIDVVLLGAALAALAWAYGADVALWAATFLMLTYSARWPTYSWSLLRYDYLAALMVAMALLRKQRPLWAGVAAGFAATVRFFPALWMLGPAAKGVAGLVQRRVRKPLLVLLAGFLAAVIALQGIAVIALGARPAKVHFDNMVDHNSSEQLSSRRVGLALALPFAGALEPKLITPELKAEIESQRPLRFAIAIALLLALGVGLRRARDDEAFAFGFLPFFLLTTASYYYYAARITLVILHAAGLKSTKHKVGLVWLLALEAMTNTVETRLQSHRVFLVGTLAWGLTLYAVVMAGWYLRDARRSAATDEPGADAESAPA